MTTKDQAQTSRPSVIDLAERVRAAIDRAERADGVLDDETEADLDLATADLGDKAAAYSAVHRELKRQASALREVAQHYAKRAQARDAAAERLKERMRLALVTAGVDYARSPEGGAYLAQTPPRVELLVDPRDLPERWSETRVEAKKKELASALKGGDEEAKRFAKLVTDNTVTWR